MSDVEKTIAVLEQNSIPYALPGTDAFQSLQWSVTGRHEATQPSVITRPQTARHVEVIMSHCVETHTPVVVRGGGHDMFGRFTAAGAVSIDLRDINAVQVSSDKSFVSVGGGATGEHVLEVLQSHNLQVPIGSCGSVGFVGWSLVGGFGPYMHSYGLGCDQIIGATLVNAEGKLIEADETLLKGLRGGGGSLGVVVELRVKAYPMQEVQAGLIFFESSDIRNTAATFFTNYHTLEQKYDIPQQFCLMPSIWLVPGMGLVLMCAFVWNGPRTEEFDLWLQRVSGLAALFPNMPSPLEAIAKTSAVGFTAALAQVLPKEVVGRSQVATVKSFSPEVVSCLAEAAACMPLDGAGGINIHIIRPDCPSVSGNVPDSICPYREPHIMVEVLGLGTDENSARLSAEWSLQMRHKFVALKDSIARTYLALTSPEFMDVEVIYGTKMEDLKRIKALYDPKGVFRNALPQIA